MIDPITDLISVLCDNKYISKVMDIPDDFDNKDELLAEIHFEEYIPASMIEFQLNGYSRSRDLEDFLENKFRTFKMNFLSNRDRINFDLVKEINDQIIASNIALNKIKEGFSTNLTFISVVDVKINYCEKMLDFIDRNFNTIKTQIEDKDSSGTVNLPVYVFRIKKDINKKLSNVIIKTLHKELKLSGYIDCSLPKFRQLFTLDQKPQESSEPILWKSNTYYTLSYFIKCINRSFLVYAKEPSNNVIARKLFLSFNGKPFTTKKERFESKSGKTREVKAVFDKIMKKCGLEKPTTEKKKPTF